MPAPKHFQEARRLQALYRYNILDTEREQAFEDITRLAAHICETPIAVINLIDRDRQWFVSEIGLGVRETPLDISICAHAILQPDLFMVPDTLLDTRFVNNPLVSGDPHLRFYAGALLETPEGLPLGTLCVLDHSPRVLTAEQQMALSALSRQVMSQLELRFANDRLHLSIMESHHRIKNSMQVISALIDMQVSSGAETVPISELQRVSQHIRGLAMLHDLLTLQTRKHETVERISSNAAMDKLIPMLQSVFQVQAFHTQLEDISLTVKQATALTLLVSELVSNAVKHGGGGDIALSLHAGSERGILKVEDSGPGFPADFDPSTSANTGLELIDNLSRWDLAGDVAYQNQETGSGGRVVVTFPLA